MTHAAALREKKHRLDARAQGMASTLNAWLARFGAQALRDFGIAKAAEIGNPVDELTELLLHFGLRTAIDAAQDAGRFTVQPETRDAVLAGRFERWPGLADVKASSAARATEIISETYTEINQTIRRELELGMKEYPQPSTAELARRMRAGVKATDVGFERAMRIARTELGIAQETGTMEGYRLTGVRKIGWSAYNDGRSGDRHHELMDGVEIELGALFELPSGVRLRYPCDPRAPVGEIVNCRCSTYAVKA